MHSIYRVTITTDAATETYTLDDCERAIRLWDSETSRTPNVTGSIEVQTFDNGVMVRDGYLLLVEADRVYLSPTLAERSK